MTKSKAKAKDTSRKEASADVNTNASLASKDKGNKHMADQPSIIEFSEDISQQEAPVPLPEGDYPAEIRAAVRKTSATSGNEYAKITFFIAPESYPADYTEGDPDGMALDYNRLTLQDTPSGRHRIRKFCEAIGAPIPKTKLDLNEWIGRTGTVNIKHGTWEGEPRAEIQKVTAP